MMMFLLWVCGGLLVFLAPPGHCALPKCTKVDDCACELDDGKQINIRSLGYQGPKAPRFPYMTPGSGSQYWTYAYNPCYNFSDKYCQNVTACQKGPSGNEAYGLGFASTAVWGDNGDKYTITYTDHDSRRSSIVELVCIESATEPILRVIGQEDASKNIFYFALTSNCACPGLCLAAPTTKEPPTKEPPTKEPCKIHSGPTPTPFICIGLSVLVIISFICGAIFMRLVSRGARRDIKNAANFQNDAKYNVLKK